MKWPFTLPVPWAVAGRELIDNPGEWRHAASYFNRQSARVTASAIRRDAIRGLAPLGRFDAEHRVVDGEFRVYVRYVGPGSTSPEPGPTCRLADWCVVTGPHDAWGCARSTSTEDGAAT